MIRLELQGGLGNQLFIWAMAHKLSGDLDDHVRIIYPLSKNNRSDRPCEIMGLMAHCKHDISISTSRSLGFLTRLIDKINTSTSLAKVIKFQNFGIFTEQSSTEVNTSYGASPKLIRGYFQNTQMVEETSKEIRRELIAFIESVALPKRIKIPDRYAVAHVRRGDTKEISKEWGCLSLKYYVQNLDNEESSIICTDETSDLEKFHKVFPFASILTSDETNSWQTLKILCNAEKLIMANSSLSWWGGWIACQRKASKVIFPSPWRPVQSEENLTLLLPKAFVTPSIFEKSI